MQSIDVHFHMMPHSVRSLRFLLDRMGDGHVVIGSDYPFNRGDERPVETVGAMRLPPDIDAKVLANNLTGPLRL